MKIPFGYGYCSIGIYTTSQTWQWLNFKVDHTSFFDIREMKDEDMNFSGNNRKYVDGVHLDFNLTLIDNSLQSASTQNNLIDFYRYYHTNYYRDNRISLTPYRSAAGTENWDAIPVDRRSWYVLVDKYFLTNISDKHRNTGQYLHLICKTRNMISKEDYSYIVYRETSDGDWGTYRLDTMGYVYNQIGTT